VYQTKIKPEVSLRSFLFAPIPHTNEGVGSDLSQTKSPAIAGPWIDFLLQRRRVFFHFNNRLTINFLLAFLNLGTTGGARNKIIEILDNPFHISNIQKANRILKLKSNSL